ncbi:MAG: integration host factor subunit alpha [Desulfobacteraceae bacterium]|nr:MAG: integration host factor subunit alpha [Desulfobacteraceae bacterium]
MTLTKDRIAESIQEEQNMTRGRAMSVVETTLEIIKDTLVSGEDILISGFGKFNVRGKNQRRGRNPATGEKLTIRSRRIVTFSPSPRLRKKLNGHHDEE